MRSGWLALPALVLLSGCAALDPSARYKQAARQLTFTLDHVASSVQLAYPLEQSRLGLRLTVGVENPTQVRFQARSLGGNISLESDGASHAIGQLSLTEGVDVKPAGRTPLIVDLSFGYADLDKAWSALKMVSRGARPGTWRLDGQVGLQALGFPVNVPLHVQKRMGGQ